MTFWEYVNARARRRQRRWELRQLAAAQRIVAGLAVDWSDARLWVGLGIYALALLVIGLYVSIDVLREDEFFKTIATLIVGTAFVNSVVQWAFGATKNGGEIAQKNADTIATTARPLALGSEIPPDRPKGTPDDPIATEEVR